MSTFAFEQDGEVRRTSNTFFRGENTNFHPTNRSFERADFIKNYVIKGWEPPAGFVNFDTPIVAFGSCFAANIGAYLHDRGYNVLTKRDNQAHVTTMGDGIVNTHAILQQFEWAWLGKTPATDLWHGYAAEDFGYDETVRKATRDLFDEAELFIITLGLSEIWYDEPSGEVFWRAVPIDKYDPTRHKFRVATHAETLCNLKKIYNIIRQHRPKAHVLFSLSPIPLTATFRSVSCITADSVSKAVLRSALDEFFRDNGDDIQLHYMPSYEAVTRLFSNQWTSDRRHVYPHVLHFNMTMFEHYYCVPGIDASKLEDAFQYAVSEDIRIGKNGSVNSDKSYSELREQKIAARREARVAARIADRAASRMTMIAQRKAERSRKKTTYRSMRNTLACLAAAAAGFLVSAMTGVSFVLE